MTARCVVFDLGAVVLRWQPRQLLRELLPHRLADDAQAQALQAVFFQGFGGDWCEFDRGTLGVDALVPRIAARTGLSDDEVRRVVDAVAGHLQPVPEVVALIERLRAAGLRRAWLSNMPAPYAEHLLRSLPFEQWFDAGGVFSSHVHIVKPDPQIYALAAQRIGEAEAQHLLFIDDSLPNVQAAQAAGWQALHFSDAGSCERELMALGVL